MKILVAYSSKTGNTKKLAAGIYSLLKRDVEDLDISICKMSNAKDLDAYDTILVGYWVDKGGPNKEATKFLSSLKGKRVGIKLEEALEYVLAYPRKNTKTELLEFLKEA